MLLRTALRSSAATWALPFLIGFVLLALGDDLSSWVTVGYWPSATANATFALPFVNAVCAGVAAWEVARFTRGRVFDQTAARGPLAITAPVLLPVAVLGLLALLAALFTSVSAAGVGPGLPQPGVLLVMVGLLLANILVGSVVGRVLPGVLAAPLALVGSFVVNAYPAALTLWWPRHLVAGGLDGCCAVDETLDPSALWSAGAFAASVSLGALALIRFRGRLPALLTALALTAGGTALAAHLARDLTDTVVRPRPPAALHCTGSRPTVCLWPEVRHPATVHRATRTVVARLERAGVPVPDTLTMAARPGPGASKLGIPTDATAADVPAGVASGLLPEPPACALRGAPYPAADAELPLAAWLYATAGEPHPVVAGRFGAPEAALARKVRDQPRDVQLAWYERNRAALTTCGTRPDLDPGKGTR
ncbi:hypothetical protein [Streptomyces sp. NPDC005955]|uniref:DUF7224 domain-containing protein n=1 Tax=Streptomyces sp. NPDC005955 TaxID=3364738 RepID=UPI0036B3E105